MRLKKGFTLIELIMVIAIIGVLAGAGAWIMAYTVKNSVFIPNQLNMDKLATDALSIMVEGDKSADGLSGAMGLRFSKSITTNNANKIVFFNGDDKTVTFELVGNRLKRTVDGDTTNIPTYLKDSGPDLLISLSGNGSNGSLFTYYYIPGVYPAQVGRIEINLIAISGTGSYNDWQGQSKQATSIAVKKLQ